MINLGSQSNCKDAKESKLVNTIPNLWQKSPIKWSTLACDIENKKRYGKNSIFNHRKSSNIIHIYSDSLTFLLSDTGNELFLPGKKIIGDVFNSTTVDKPEQCQSDCR